MFISIRTMNDLKILLRQAWRNSLSYEHYLRHVTEKASAESEEGTPFDALNLKRMRRWDKVLHISGDIREQLSSFSGQVNWLVITETWCGDGAHTIPVMHQLSELSEAIDFGVVYRDAYPELMDHFLTEGTRSIPILIMMDKETFDVLGTFGPRPETLTELVRSEKQRKGKLSDDFKVYIQKWYNKDKGQSTIDALVSMLERTTVLV